MFAGLVYIILNKIKTFPIDNGGIYRLLIQPEQIYKVRS